MVGTCPALLMLSIFVVKKSEYFSVGTKKICQSNWSILYYQKGQVRFQIFFLAQHFISTFSSLFFMIGLWRTHHLTSVHFCLFRISIILKQIIRSTKRKRDLRSLSVLILLILFHPYHPFHPYLPILILFWISKEKGNFLNSPQWFFHFNLTFIYSL